MTSEELKARTKAFALRVIKLVDAMPRSLAAQVIGKQLLRSATSVGANYNELVAIAAASRKTAKNNPPSLSIVNRQSAIGNSSDSREHP